MNLVIYLRVSTQEQNHSYLGISAQEKDINNKILQLKKQNDNVKVINKFIEIASGKDLINRPKLQQAIKLCKDKNTYLIVQKIDRLARNLSDGINIFEKELNKRVYFADIDTNDSMIIAILLAHAQKEREQISIRTKKALHELKAQGKKLGRPYKRHKNGKIIKGQNTQAIKKAIQIRQEKHKNYYKHVIEWICDYRNKGDTYQSIANMLNNRGLLTIHESSYTKALVRKLFLMYCNP